MADADKTARGVGIRRLAAPIVEFGSVPGYGPIFNAGAILHDGRYHLFARGVHEEYRQNPGSGARFVDYVSDLLVFTSEDGVAYEFQQVLAAASPDGIYSYEDPRVQVVNSRGSDHFVVTYTNLPAPETNTFWRIGVHRLVYGGGAFSLEEGSGAVIGPEAEPNKDAVLFNLSDGRVALIHRIYPNMQLAIFDSLEQVWSPPAGYWDAHMAALEQHTIIRPLGTGLGVGAGAPPLVTDSGLLLLYHERDGRERYSTKAALLDPATGAVRALLPEPVMSPEVEWERQGDVNNVVFIQGAIPQPDGTIYMTYGAADRCVGAAYVSTDELLRALGAAA